MSLLKQYEQDFLLLVEAGFIAVNQFDEDAATKLFKAAELLNEKDPLPQLGAGYIHLCKLELKQASKIFSETLAQHPDHEMTRALLGLAYSLNPAEQAKGEKVLHEAASQAKDPMVKTLAQNAIDFVNRFVKKNPSPAQAHVPGKSSTK